MGTTILHQCTHQNKTELSEAPATNCKIRPKKSEEKAIAALYINKAEELGISRSQDAETTIIIAVEMSFHNRLHLTWHFTVSMIILSIAADAFDKNAGACQVQKTAKRIFVLSKIEKVITDDQL